MRVNQDPTFAIRNKEELYYLDKKKIIQQNNWALRTFNSHMGMKFNNNNNQKDKQSQTKVNSMGDEEPMNYNSPSTLSLKFTTLSLNRMGSGDQQPGLVTFNDESTEEFDKSIYKIQIKLPMLKELKVKKIDIKKGIKYTYSTTFRIEKEFNKNSKK